MLFTEGLGLLPEDATDCPRLLPAEPGTSPSWYRIGTSQGEMPLVTVKGTLVFAASAAGKEAVVLSSLLRALLPARLARLSRDVMELAHCPTSHVWIFLPDVWP